MQHKTCQRRIERSALALEARYRGCALHVRETTTRASVPLENFGGSLRSEPWNLQLPLLGLKLLLRACNTSNRGSRLPVSCNAVSEWQLSCWPIPTHRGGHSCLYELTLLRTSCICTQVGGRDVARGAAAHDRVPNGHHLILVSNECYEL